MLTLLFCCWKVDGLEDVLTARLSSPKSEVSDAGGRFKENLLTIRAFQPNDEDAVIDLWRRCDLVRPQNDPKKDITRKMLVRPDLFLVAEVDGTIVGSVMAGYEGHRGWVNYLAVSPDHRRNGIGKALMLEAQRLLLAEGCPKINLQVRSSNRQVIAFYQAIGFAVDDVVSLGKRLIPD